METMMQHLRAYRLMTTYASFTGSIMLIQTMANQIIPRPLKDYLRSFITSILGKRSSENKFLNLVLEPHVGLSRNELFEASEIYLSTIVSPNVTQLQVAKIQRSDSLSITLDKNQEVCDTYKGIKVIWKVGSKNVSQLEGGGEDAKENAFLVLSFEKGYREVILNEYLWYVVEEAKKEVERNKTVKLCTLNMGHKYDIQASGGMFSKYGGWGSITLDHPATFDTMAMNSELKKAIIEDLDRFVRRREFYKRVGKAWKRGYLLYGPPGTGKSSLIAAIANYLKFDVFDIELKSVHSDAELRRTLLSTSNRSIIVIEDIDCSEKMHKRVDVTHDRESSYRRDGNEHGLSMSGMLNFADGLWSSCGDERIIIFTTNHKDKIDPALLRPGRMDMHIHMSYCTSESFKILASRYLGDEIGDGSNLICEIEGLIETVEVTPAEVAEELMRNEDPGLALQGVSNLLKRKASEMNGAGEDGMNGMIEENLKENIGSGTGNGGSSFNGAKKPKIGSA